MVFPFDVNHIAIRKYHHLGEGIDYDEVERMKGELKHAIETIAAKPTDDSPVYTFLKDLRPPVRGEKEAATGSSMPCCTVSSALSAARLPGGIAVAPLGAAAELTAKSNPMVVNRRTEYIFIPHLPCPYSEHPKLRKSRTT